MRHILILLLLCCTLTLSGATYYVSSTGNDAANGLSESTSWRTIAKVNSFSFQAGDKIYFKRGNIWNEKLIPSSSGTSVNRITFGAYGTGAKPVISGFTTISGWTNYGGGVYSKAVSCESTPRMVTFDGVNQRMGRWPKLAVKDYNMYDSFSGSTQITDSELNGHNWTGGNVVVRINLSYLTSSYISGHSGSAITFSGGSTLCSGYGYFINNHIGTLTELGEWAYISGTLYMYFGAANPNSHTVKIAAKNYGANLSGRSYITLDGLAFEGFNDAIYTSTSSYVTIQNCDIRFNSSLGIRFGIMSGGGTGGGGSYNVVDNNTITDCNNMGMEIGSWREFSYCSITNNVLTNIGAIPGMGGNQYQSYGGIRLWTEHSLAQYNHLTNIGYHGIAFYGNGTSVRNNFVDNFCMVKADGGGIYAVQQKETPTTGSEVTDNIVINGAGIDPKYSDYLGWAAMGIYMDDRMTNVLVDGNTVWNCAGDGIYLHGAINVTVRDNIVGNCGKNTGHNAQLRSVRDFPTEPHSTGLVITGNQFISLNITNADHSGNITYAAIFQAIDGAAEIKASISVADNNYYAMPLFPNSGNLIRLWEGSFGVVAVWKTLSEWKSYTGKDANSKISQVTITNVNQARIIYNETKVNKIVSLDAGYIDVTGKKYSSSITLLPYTSVILTTDPNSTTAPVIPVYSSSSIESATPALLEMTYNLTLANIVPAASAFTVKVNSVARTVNTVVISGTKVQLTLASPIVNGNTVTVSYTKPANNPIQAPAGGVASSITNQSVITNFNNNLNPTATITSPVTNSSFNAPASIAITANAVDSDGSISLVEFYNGTTKLGTASAAPYTFNWNNVAAGVYSLTVVATDNLNARSTSSVISVTVIDDKSAVNVEPVITISNPTKGITYDNLSTITIEAVASDPDGTITKVEFFNGPVRLVELNSAPYSYTWKDVSAGSYSITAVATDNLNASTTSSSIEFVVGDPKEISKPVKYDGNSEIINLYPNPNDGHFSIDFIDPLQNEKSEIIITDMAGKQVYQGPVLKEEVSKQFDLSNSKSGIYVMLIKDKEIIITKKFIKK